MVSFTLPLAANYQSLRDNSPFVPEGFVDPSTVRPTPPPPRQRQNDPLDRLEFRSIWVFDGQPSFSIYDAVNDRSYWVRENQSREGFTVTAFDSRSDTITVRYEGRTREVPLKSSQVLTASEESTPSETSSDGQSRPPSRTAATGSNLSPEDRERLLRERAEELRQRQVVRRRVITPDNQSDNPGQ